MSSMPKVLILYASYGDGHLQVSKALQESFEGQGVSDVLLVDLFAEAYPALNALTKFVYVKSYSVLPSVYGWIYSQTKHMRNDTLFTNWFHSWGIGTLRRIIRTYRPDIVINTFPMLVMPELCKKSGLNVPIYNVLTDYTLHRRWVHPKVNKYYVATEELQTELTEAGIPAHRILVSGIPLKQAFRTTPLIPKQAILAKYNLQPGLRTILVMAGSYGVMQGLKELAHELAGKSDTQMVIVCGRNKILYRDMLEAFDGHPSYRVFEYVQTVHELMAAADCIVTKPGGITLSEAIWCQLPILLYRPVPGQELDNAVFLERKGAALIASTPSELALHIVSLLDDKALRGRMRQAIRSLQREDASQTIVGDILSDAIENRTKPARLYPVERLGPFRPAHNDSAE